MRRCFRSERKNCRLLLPAVAASLIKGTAIEKLSVKGAEKALDTGSFFMSASQKDEQAVEPVLLSIPASSEFLGLSAASIYRLVGLGKLKAVKAGSKTLLTMASLRKYATSLPAAKIKPPTNRMGARPSAV